jgi:hypothetical protein
MAKTTKTSKGSTTSKSTGVTAKQKGKLNPGLAAYLAKHGNKKHPKGGQ